MESSLESEVPENETNAGTPEKRHGFDYIVKSGDTLGAIIRGYNKVGVNITIESPLESNPGLELRRLKVGQKLFIVVDDPTGQ